MTSSYFQVHCAIASIIGQGFSPPQWPPLAADPASQNNIHSLQSQRWIYSLLNPPCPPPLLLSPCSRLFRLFIFNPADVPHVWRRLGRNTDTVNQRGRGRARLRESHSHPLKKESMSPVTHRRGAQRRSKKPVGNVSENTICLVLIPRLFAAASLPRPSSWKRNTPTRLSEQKGEELHINLTSLSGQADTAHTERRPRGDARRL